MFHLSANVIAGGYSGWKLNKELNISGSLKKVSKTDGGSVRVQVGDPETLGVCFTGDTLVKTEDGHKKISDIKVGDKVYAENEKTGEKGYKNVKQIFINDAYILLHISVKDTVIKTTFSHPFYVVGKGWVEAKDLKVGDVLKLANGETTEVEALEIVELETPVKVYNFEVEDWHTYYVSEYDVLVHNTCTNPYAQGGSQAYKSSADIPKDILDTKPKNSPDVNKWYNKGGKSL